MWGSGGGLRPAVQQGRVSQGVKWVPMASVKGTKAWHLRGGLNNKNDLVQVLVSSPYHVALDNFLGGNIDRKSVV